MVKELYVQLRITYFCKTLSYILRIYHFAFQICSLCLVLSVGLFEKVLYGGRNVRTVLIFLSYLIVYRL